MKQLKNTAKFMIGEQVRHRIYGFRGVVFDVDPEFSNTDEWYQSIPPESRPRKDQPFYHLFAESTEQSPYVAYVSEQNLVCLTRTTTRSVIPRWSNISRVSRTAATCHACCLTDL